METDFTLNQQVVNMFWLKVVPLTLIILRIIYHFDLFHLIEDKKIVDNLEKNLDIFYSRNYGCFSNYNSDAYVAVSLFLLYAKVKVFSLSNSSNSNLGKDSPEKDCEQLFNKLFQSDYYKKLKEHGKLAAKSKLLELSLPNNMSIFINLLKNRDSYGLEEENLTATLGKLVKKYKVQLSLSNQANEISSLLEQINVEFIPLTSKELFEIEIKKPIPNDEMIRNLCNVLNPDNNQCECIDKALQFHLVRFDNSSKNFLKILFILIKYASPNNDQIFQKLITLDFNLCGPTQLFGIRQAGRSINFDPREELYNSFTRLDNNDLKFLMLIKNNLTFTAYYYFSKDKGLLKEKINKDYQYKCNLLVSLAYANPVLRDYLLNFGVLKGLTFTMYITLVSTIIDTCNEKTISEVSKEIKENQLELLMICIDNFPVNEHKKDESKEDDAQVYCLLYKLIKFMYKNRSLLSEQFKEAFSQFIRKLQIESILDTSLETSKFYFAINLKPEENEFLTFFVEKLKKEEAPSLGEIGTAMFPSNPLKRLQEQQQNNPNPGLEKRQKI